MEGQKRCCICKQWKGRSEFNKKNTSKDGLQPHCRECNRERSRRYYRENTAHHKGVVTALKRKRAAENKQRIVAYLREHPCVDCGEDDLVVLEFDHRGDKTGHVWQLANEGFGWARISAEIRKCDVRCVNCHRRRHAREQGWMKGDILVPKEAVKP